MRKSIIDIGTNTMLMLIAEYDAASGSVTTILDVQRMPRLGKGVDSNRNILPEAVDKAVEILNEYTQISKENNSEQIIATATSFIRDANNRSEFIEQVKQKTGIEIEILTGEDEAKWTFIGGTYDKLHSSDKNNICLIDVGGGSTEISNGSIGDSNNVNFTDGISLNVGSVRLNEKFLKNHPPSFDSIVKATEFVNKNLLKFDGSEKSYESFNLIGVAGTTTTLAMIKLGLTAYNASLVDGQIISINEIESIFKRIAVMQLEEIYAIGTYMEGRADIILPGILILKTFMEKFGFKKITVSTKGLRYGIFLREIRK